MHLKSDIIEIMNHDKVDEVIKELFESLINIYQIGLVKTMKSSDFIYNCVNLFYYKCQKINPKRGESYIDSADQIKNKKTTLNYFNDDNKWFQYVATFALDHKKQEKTFIISKYKRKGLNYTLGKGDWKRFEKKNPIIALNILHMLKNLIIILPTFPNKT